MSTRPVDELWPEHKQLVSDPALAILAALDATLALAILSLKASHPLLTDYERPYYPPPFLPSDKAAPKVISIGRKLQRALQTYRYAVARDNQIKQERLAAFDDTPF